MFYDYLKMLIKHTKECGIIKNNINENTIMKEVYKSYEPYFREIINEAESKENFKLIRKIKNNYKLGLITTCRRKYLDILNNQEKIYELFDIVMQEKTRKEE